ncbi:ASCH domain-containing protein [Enterococcus sp. AZ109]|uniref:ASCH domain-containing protein n=1 Tax=Enterococcus sp. AZ109 TaxID=2774634 RepID=UPI003F1FC675
MKVLMSIKPEFVTEIAKGTKKVEYRKTLFQRTDITAVVVYATKPCGKIVGEFTIEKIIKDQPAIIWAKTKDYSPSIKESFDNYFQDREIGYALVIKEFISYDKPLELSVFSLKAAPQSFCYLME